jgi:hypothetical protein
MASFWHSANMSQEEISRVENQINNGKQTLLVLEQEELRMVTQFNTKKQELLAASERALAVAHSEPLVMSLMRQSLEIEGNYLHEKARLENDIRSIRRNLERQQQQLEQLKRNYQSNIWSPTFK